MVARAGGMQAKATPPRTRRASIGLRLARTVYSCLSSELYALCSHAIAMSMQLCSHEGYTAKGGKLSYMALAMERECTAYRSLLLRSGAVLAALSRC